VPPRSWGWRPPDAGQRVSERVLTAHVNVARPAQARSAKCLSPAVFQRPLGQSEAEDNERTAAYQNGDGREVADVQSPMSAAFVIVFASLREGAHTQAGQRFGPDQLWVTC